MMAMKMTAAQVREGMSKRWAAPEYAIMWEVGRATGAVANQRYADAVMMSLWPSRGLELHGVEIKVSRSDWRREALNPRKAETIAAYCDRWWVHTPSGIVQDTSELPPAWGLREFDGSKWKTIKEAEKTAALPCDRTFLASLLRRADSESRWEIEQAARRMTEEVTKQAEARIEGEIARRTSRATEAIKKLEEFEAASGLTLNDYMMGGAKEIGALVRIVHAAGIGKTWGGASGILKAAKEVVASMERAIAEADLTLPKEGDAL